MEKRMLNRRWWWYGPTLTCGLETWQIGFRCTDNEIDCGVDLWDGMLQNSAVLLATAGASLYIVLASSHVTKSKGTFGNSSSRGCSERPAPRKLHIRALACSGRVTKCVPDGQLRRICIKMSAVTNTGRKRDREILVYIHTMTHAQGWSDRPITRIHY